MLPPSPTPCRQVLVRAPANDAKAHLQAGLFYPVSRLRQPTSTSDLECHLLTDDIVPTIVSHDFFARHEDGVNIVVIHLN